LILIAGVNDVYQGRPVDHVISQLRTMYDRAARAEIRTLAGTIVPYDTATDDQNQAMRRINDWIRGAATGDPWLACAETRAAVAAPGHPDRLVDSPDRLHPSPAGYRLMAEAIRPVLEALLRGIL
jgi:lysophospholipase L1-like esterase